MAGDGRTWWPAWSLVVDGACGQLVGGGWLGKGGFEGVKAEAGDEFFLRAAETIYWGSVFTVQPSPI